MTGLLGVDDAQARLLASARPLAVVRAGLDAAAGRFLASGLTARRTQPPFTASAMDGYAIRWSDRAGPWRLIGDSAAGRGFDGTVQPGEAVRILTGAPLPHGADTVLVQEDVAVFAGLVSLTGRGPPRRDAHIRVAGLDFVEGAPVGTAGMRLTPARIGLFAAAGHAEVEVHRRPRVALLATGDELVPPGTTPGRHQIVSSNGVMLAALFAAAGADVIDGGIVADDRSVLAAALRANAGVDLLVTIGGASVGDHDHVLPVLRELGATIDFWKIAIKPGKPMLAGRMGDTIVVGLPGNPVSAFVCAHLFVLPMLRRMLGSVDPLPPRVGAQLANAVAANGRRRDHLRGTLRDGVVSPASVQDSSMLRVLAESNVLIVREPDAPALDAGDTVSCVLLDTDSGVA